MNRAQGYCGSGAVPQVRCDQVTVISGSANWNVAVCVSVMLALVSFSTKTPPEDSMRVGQPRFSIQRTASSMWTHMSPTMPLLYSQKPRHERGWTIALYGRIGAGPVHIS